MNLKKLSEMLNETDAAKVFDKDGDGNMSFDEMVKTVKSNTDGGHVSVQAFMDAFTTALSKDAGDGGPKTLTPTEEADAREKRMRGEAMKIKERQRLEKELKMTADIQKKSHAANAAEQQKQADQIEATHFAALPKWKQEKIKKQKAADAEQADLDASNSAIPAWKRNVAAKKRSSKEQASEAAAEKKRQSDAKNVHTRLGNPAPVTSDGSTLLSKIGYEKRDLESHEAHQSFTATQDAQLAAKAAAGQAMVEEELAKEHMELQAAEEERVLVESMPAWKRAVYSKKKAAEGGTANNSSSAVSGNDDQTKGPDWAEGCDLTSLDRQRLMKLPAWKRAIQLRKRAKQKREEGDEDVAASLERVAGVAERIAEKQAEHDDDDTPSAGPTSPRRQSNAAGGGGSSYGVFELLQARRAALEGAEKEAEKRAAPAKLLTAAKLQKKKVEPIAEDGEDGESQAPTKKKKKRSSLNVPKESPPMPRRRSVAEMHQDVKDAAIKAREEKVLTLKAAMLIQRAFRRFKVRRQKRQQAEADQLRKIAMQSESLKLEAATDTAIAQEQRKQLELIQAQRKLLSDKLRNHKPVHPGKANSNRMSKGASGRPNQFNTLSGAPAGHHSHHRHGGGGGGGGGRSGMGTVRSPQAAPSASRTARKGAVAEAIRQAKLSAASKKTGVSEAADSSNGIYVVDGQYVNKDGSPADHEFAL